MTHRMRLTLAAVVLTAITVIYGITLVQGASYRHQVTRLRQTLYSECLSRQAYDARSQATRAAFRDYYVHYMTVEAHNRFIDDKLRAQRLADAQALVDSLTVVLASTPAVQCAAIKP